MGIVRESFNILLRSSRRKLLWVLALTLLLPFSFASLGYRFFSAHHFLKITPKQIEETILRGDTIWRVWREVLVGVAAYGAFSLALSVLSTAAMVYTVASIYTANIKNLKVSIRDCLEGRRSHGLEAPHVNIPLVFHNLLRLYDALHVGQWPPVHRLRPHQLALAFPLGLFLVTVVGLCLQMYVRTVCYLASVVSVLEDKYYGLAAMKKSIRLIKGKRTTALALIILHDIFAAAIGELFVYSVADGHSHGVGITARALYGLLLVGLLCFVNLMVMLTECLIYFACKSYHHESIDNNSLFKVYKSGTMSL